MKANKANILSEWELTPQQPQSLHRYVKALESNIDHEISKICSFVRKKVRDAHAKGVVLGISGGIDSAVTAALCKTALGAKRVTGVLMFEEDPSNSIDRADAISLVKMLGINTIEMNLTPVIRAISDSLTSSGLKISRLTLANIKARTRMVSLYAIANQRNLLVAGTGDRSEILVGYFTKYGDGGVDFLPIGHLLKTEVRTLGSNFRLPYQIVTKPSSPNLWPGQKASEELPADYDMLDRVITLLYDKHASKSQIQKMTGASASLLNDVEKLHEKSFHKRMPPPVP